MRRFILALLLLCAPAPSFALSLLQTPRAPYYGPGDFIRSWAGWWGVRAYTNAIAVAGSQALVNVRNVSSTHTCDVKVNPKTGSFGVTSNCSTAADGGQDIFQFCGGATVGNCTIATVYSQTGGSGNMAQGTTASQPRLNPSCLTGNGPVSGGVPLPCMNNNGALFLTATEAGVTSQDYQTFFMAQRLSGTTESAVFGNNAAVRVGFNTSGTLYQAASTIVTAAYTEGVWHSCNDYMSNASTGNSQCEGTKPSYSTIGSTAMSTSAGVTGLFSNTGASSGAACACNITEVGIGVTASLLNGIRAQGGTGVGGNAAISQQCRNDVFYWNYLGAALNSPPDKCGF